jgi:uncharacterized protein (AIM24 family)
MQLERDYDARRWLEEVATPSSESRELHSILGVIYMRLGEYPAARRAFLQAGDDNLLQALNFKLIERGSSLEELEALEREENSQRELLEMEIASDIANADLLDDGNWQITDTDDNETTEPDKEPDAEPNVDAKPENWQWPMFESQPQELRQQQDPLEKSAAIDSDELELDPDLALELDLVLDLDLVDTPEQESLEGAFSVVVLPPEPVTDPDLQLPTSDDVPFVISTSSPRVGLDQTDSSTMNLKLSRGEDASHLWLNFDELFENQNRVFALLNDGRLLVKVQQRAFLRMRDLVVIKGNSVIQVEYKRFQGKAVGQVFGPRNNPIVCVEGSSQLLLQAQSEGYRSSLELSSGQLAFFREGSVLGFSSQIEWENGRIPASIQGIEDLTLDQFWGQGEMIIESQGPLWGIPVQNKQKLRVEYDRFIGWVGDLIPQIIPSKQICSSIQGQALIEFEGEGGVLISS